MGALIEQMLKAMIVVDGKKLFGHLLEKIDGEAIITTNGGLKKFSTAKNQ